MMTDDQIQKLIVAYNQARHNTVSWCSNDTFRMVKFIMADAEPLGFTDWHLENAAYSGCRIAGRYGTMPIYMDISQVGCTGGRGPAWLYHGPDVIIVGFSWITPAKRRNPEYSVVLRNPTGYRMGWLVNKFV